MCPILHHHLAYGTRTGTPKQDAWGVCLPAWALDIRVDVAVDIWDSWGRVELGALWGADMGFLGVEGVDIEIPVRG